MKKSLCRLAWLSVLLFLNAPTGSSTALQRRPVISLTPQVALTTNPPATVNLSDFNPFGDGIGDDGPAFQRALDSLAASGGGTLFVPQGHYAIITPVSGDFTGLASSITIMGVESSTEIAPPTSPGSELAKGLDLETEIYPRTGDEHNAISIKGLQNFLIHDIAFVGTQTVVTDAAVTLLLSDIGRASVRHCEFYGLATWIPHGGIVKAVRSYLEISKSKFLGSTATSGYYIPVVENVEWRGIEVRDSHFVDYGLRPDFFSKTYLGASIAWINIGNAAAPDPDSPRREVIINNVLLDEGSYWGISSLPFRYTPASAPIDLVYISGLVINVSNFYQTGHMLFDVDRVMIQNSLYQWSHNATSAVSFHSCGNVILDQLTCIDHAENIQADADTQRLTVINSSYATVESLAETTNIIHTETEFEDPVQYVRAHFLSVLGREPDPAAHFYWSDLLIRCNGDFACAEGVRSLLANYLANSPASRFSITGRVTDDKAVPLAGAIVTLGGSQSTAATTNESGDYSFFNLPTSGVYTVKTSKAQYVFREPPYTVVTPANEQTLNFVALPIPQLINQQGSDSALALNSLMFLAGPFRLDNPFSFGADSRARIILFANDLNVTDEEAMEVVSVQAQDHDGRIFPLSIEFVGNMPELSFVTQIVVRLPDNIQGEGGLLITLSRKGVPSNQVRIGIISNAL